MRALSIRPTRERVPRVELILRGIKKIEYRNRPTRIIGEPFYIYAAMQPGDSAGFKQLKCKPGDLPTGMILGIATIAKVTGSGKEYQWHLTDVKRLDTPLKPKKHPQPSCVAGAGNWLLQGRPARFPPARERNTRHSLPPTPPSSQTCRWWYC